MIKIDPQQELFTQLKIELEKIGYSVYDGFLPPKDTPYPFIYLGDSQLIDEVNKTAVFGSVLQTIHVWHNNPKQRGVVSNMALNIKTVCRQIKHTSNFAWFVRNINQQIIPDNTTNQPLLHGVLEVEFIFS